MRVEIGGEALGREAKEGLEYAFEYFGN